MRLTTRRVLEGAEPAPGAAPVSRSRLLAALIPATLALGLFGQTAQTAAASAGMARDHRVGHRVERIVVPGSTRCPDLNAPCHLEDRQVDVHLWYPADTKAFSDADKTVYKSALHDDRLTKAQRDRIVGAGWDPLSWQLDAEIARETAAIDPTGQAFPVIVFSHGATTDPINYAHTLELIAGAGFVVAAPYHVNNTQDDVRIDFINGEAQRLQQPPLFDCNDGRPRPCARPSIPRSMEDRVRDISHVLDAIPSWFGGRADASRAGVMGHSRGTLTALAAAGGSDAWGRPGSPLKPESRVKAVMGMGIGGTLPVTLQPNLSHVKVPTVLVAGGRDRNSKPEFSEAAFEQIASEEKALVSIKDATHRSYNSNNCAQVQAAGAIARNRRAILDRHTVAGLVNHPVSGQAMDYCSLGSFTNPENITPLVASICRASPPDHIPETECPGLFSDETSFTSANVPLTGLDTDEVKHGMKELATTLFGTVLKRVGNDGTHFTRHLAPKWLVRHEPMVDGVEAFAGAEAICPPGQVDAGDSEDPTDDALLHCAD